MVTTNKGELMTEELYKEMLYRAMSDDGLMARIMSEAPDNSKGDNYDE
jgi:hypothetical protein